MKTLTSLAVVAVLSMIAQTASAAAEQPATWANPAIESAEMSQGVYRSRIAGYQTLSWRFYLYQGQTMEVSGYGVGTSDLDMWVANPFGGEAGQDSGFGDEFFDSVFAWHTGYYTVYITNQGAAANVVTLITR